MPPINFPTSTAPGVNPTETGGRLINCFAEKAPTGSRSEIVWRRVAGLINRFATTQTAIRGALLVGSVLYVVSNDKAYSITNGGVVTELTGTVGGSGPVTMARNMKAPIPDVLIVHSSGMSSINISGSAVTSFSDGDLPSVNSICFIDGYFILTTEAGGMYQSGINDTTFSSVDRTTAEADPDGLYRGVALGSDLIAMGFASLEFYSNAANPTGFASNRGVVVPVGLKGPWAVAGFEPGFSDNLIFVANDNTVRTMQGYTPAKISPPELDRLIEAVSSATDLIAFVYQAAGHAYWVLSGPGWTWVYDVSTGNWHERQTYGHDDWRCRYGVNAWGKWFTFDLDSGKVFELSSTAKRDDESPLVWTLGSAQSHRFPGRAVVNKASFDFEVGVGIDAGISPIETEPVVRIRWSDDGGRTWGNYLTRSLGTQGENVPIDINRAGMTGRKGRIWEMTISDPIEIAFFGGAMDVEERAA
ncbi:hypothetical protein PRN20_18225 [Devosia sp. ZB163]|uniref:hypothetical protein n=1 Tax=Devosia sp. ZB163 TaxID=3025938 RepID=UPI00235FA1D2|nr:hypothetical protein [Devosia sp. ZB163]MDC9825675.1 hypothetical protein [Devosia sp. ZB163]